MHKDIQAVGVYDSELRLFESQYVVPEGISYNSFIIRDESPALFDTVDPRMADRWWQQVQEAFAGTDGPAYLIVQHLEPDHASQVGRVMNHYPACRMVCTSTARKMLPMLADCDTFADRIIEVGDGDSLSLGRHQLQFITAPMVHWPEVMMVYDKESRTLFSADGFGRFGNPDPAQPWMDEARRYFINIVGKYGPSVQGVIKKLAGREIETIAPLHGPVLEGDLSPYLAGYHTWSSYAVENSGVLVAHSSIHGMTAAAAREMAAILREAGAPEVVLVDLCRDDMAEAVQHAFRLSHLVVMSPTYDADMFPPMHDFIHHLALKTYRNRRVAIVENGLWAPMAARKMRAMLETLKGVTIVEPVVSLHGRMTEADAEAMRKLAANLLSE